MEKLTPNTYEKELLSNVMNEVLEVVENTKESKKIKSVILLISFFLT